MKLFCTLTSPYSRKVRIAALEKGVMNQVEVVIAPPAENSPDLHAANPLGKIPALITDDGLAIYDSPVICEYLDGLSASNPLYPAEAKKRLQARRLEALGDGMMDSAVAWFYEHSRGENERSPKWIARWEAAMKRALDVLESEKEELPRDFHMGAVALATAMTYIVLRYKIDLAGGYPKCAAWLAEFEKRPAMKETAPPPPQ